MLLWQDRYVEVQLVHLKNNQEREQKSTIQDRLCMMSRISTKRKVIKTAFYSIEINVAKSCAKNPKTVNRRRSVLDDFSMSPKGAGV
jgi:hypothetical protein